MNHIVLQLRWAAEDLKLPQSSSQVWFLDHSPFAMQLYAGADLAIINLSTSIATPQVQFLKSEGCSAKELCFCHARMM